MLLQVDCVVFLVDTIIEPLIVDNLVPLCLPVSWKALFLDSEL